MQYITHNFEKNYNAYKKHGENALLNDMIMDDVAKLIVFDKEGLLFAIAESGYGINRKPSNRDILKLLKKNIPADENLTENIAKLIIINNSDAKSKKRKSIQTDKYKYKSSTKQKKTQNTSLKSLKKEVKSSFLNMDGVLDNKLNQHTKNKLQMEGKIVSTDDLKKNIRKAYIKSSLITTAIIIGGYFLLKKVASIPMFAGGGYVEEVPEPIASPIMEQPPMGAVPPTQADAGQTFDAHGMKIG